MHHRSIVSFPFLLGLIIVACYARGRLECLRMAVSFENSKKSHIKRVAEMAKKLRAYIDYQ